MYSELLSEADATKKLEANLDELDKDIVKLKDREKLKTRIERDAKRQFDVLEHVGLINQRIWSPLWRVLTKRDSETDL